MIKKILSAIQYCVKRLMPKPNDKIRKSNWYHNKFPHLREFESLKENSDIICIGSTPAKNTIDFKAVAGVVGSNLAVQPETIFYDFQVLKNYHSFLKPGGTALFVLCPFTFLKDFYRNEYGSTSYLNIRYYPILHRAMIDTFDYKLYRKYVKQPMRLGIQAWKRLLKDSPVSKTMFVRNNPDNPEKSQQFCKERVKNWMREFHLADLNPDNIPEETGNAINGNIKIFQDMKLFIEERGYKACIVVPPFPDEMTSLLPQDFVKHTLFDSIEATGLPYISYYGKKEWLSRSFYYHGFLLNAAGRELLTKDVMSKLMY